MGVPCPPLAGEALRLQREFQEGVDKKLKRITEVQECDATETQ
jgi:hypothetical protein